jgi:hypothetical protein
MDLGAASISELGHHHNPFECLPRLLPQSQWLSCRATGARHQCLPMRHQTAQFPGARYSIRTSLLVGMNWVSLVLARMGSASRPTLDMTREQTLL